MIISGIAVVVVIAGFWVYRTMASNRAAAQDAIQTATVQLGSISSTLSYSGNTHSGQSATIAWQTSGKVGEVTLNEGDLVQENQELVALDPNSLPTEMITAKQNLIDAQQALDDLLNSKLQQAQAQQAVVDAQNNLDSLKGTAAENASQAQQALADAQDALEKAQRTRAAMNYPHTTDQLVIEKAETDYRLAKKAYNEALNQYNKVDQKKLINPERVQALNILVSAKQKMDTAFATYNWYLQDYTPTEIAQADAAVAVAQANLEKAQADWDNYKNGTSSAAIALAEAQLSDAQRAWERVKDGPNPEDVAAAQAAVDAAQASLDRAHLVAPFNGTITEVDVKTGDLVSSGETAFRIDDLSSLYIDLQVSEVDLPSLKVGQPASLEFDAILDKTYNGEVTNIGMVGSVSQGVVNYPVTVRVTDADKDILPGMTASVTITVDHVDNVLIVPNRAIHTSVGQKTVTVLYEGQQFSIPVRVGLTNDTESEVTSDQLREGDSVVVTSSTSTTTSNNSGNFIRGGDFGGPPGGFP
jgi:HlyD family secretion protein